MAERGWGRIVNVSSTAGKRPSAKMGRVLGRQGRRALALPALRRPLGGRTASLVNAVCPGPVKSEMWMARGGLLDQSVAQRATPAATRRSEAAGAKRPIGRLAEVDEIAAAIAFLCSERASYVPARPGASTAAPCR